jgi:hypothetical protein
MDFEVIGSIASFIAGVVSAGAISWIQQRHAAAVRREEREWEAQQRREDRDEKRRTDEIDAVRDLYRRVAQLGMEYRWVEGIGTEQWEHWKKFLPRFHEVKAELSLRGSAEVREAFRKYLDTVQVSQYEEDQVGYVAEFWEHHDQAMEELTFLMRADVEHRLRAAPVSALPRVPFTNELLAAKKELSSGGG